MKSKITLITILTFNILFLSLSAQTDLKYYLDYDRKFVDSSNAVFYSIYKESPDSLTISGITETYLINGILLKKEEYYQDGENRREKEIYYYDNGKIESITNSIALRFDGEQIAYFSNGKIKRRAVYSMDKLIEGRSFTSEGKDTIYYLTEDRMPTYPGGAAEMEKFIRENLKYPKEARKKKISGTVEIGVLIGKLGEVEKINITKSVHPLLDKEAIRIIMSMPKWSPGFQKDQLLKKYEKILVKFEIVR